MSILYFNPRPPVRGATACYHTMRCHSPFQSTPPCAGGDCGFQVLSALRGISIHAPLCGGRRKQRSVEKIFLDFNPRPPVRGATAKIPKGAKYLYDFNPRPPVRGATIVDNAIYCIIRISIHAPCAGGDIAVRRLYPQNQDFNPRPPVRGATYHWYDQKAQAKFQSTPPCAGGDA